MVKGEDILGIEARDLLLAEEKPGAAPNSDSVASETFSNNSRSNSTLSSIDHSGGLPITTLGTLQVLHRSPALDHQSEDGELRMACKFNVSTLKFPEQMEPSQTSPAFQSFWPHHIQHDHLCNFKSNPNVREGPIYTKIFNSTLVTSGQSLEKDLNLLCTYVPARKIADTLFARYVNSVHPIMPLLNMRAFHPQYEKLWNERSPMDLSFYIILFAVLYAGSVTEFEELSVKNAPAHQRQASVDRMRHLVGATEIALALSDFPGKVTLVGLQASVILHSVIRNDCRTDDCGSVANLVRLAQLLELNRDPQDFHKLSDHHSIQERRLLWWHVFFLDCSTSLSSRIPPMIVDGEFDTCLPSEYNKTLSGNYELEQAIAFSNGRFRWAETCNRILRQAHSIRGFTQLGVEQLIQDIENLGLQCTASIQKMVDPNNVMPNQEAFVAFSTSMLSTFQDRCYCLLNMVLYTSLMQPETSSTADFLVNSLGDTFTKNVLHLLLEFCKHGEMPRNAMFVWEIRKYQPIQVLFFLLRNLIQDIKRMDWLTSGTGFDVREDERVLSIERGMSTLGYLSEHTTQLCKERWQMLRELKDITWDQIFNSPFASICSSPKNLKPNSDISDTFGEDWDAIIDKLTTVENTIDENIFVRQWDEWSGHYVM